MQNCELCCPGWPNGWVSCIIDSFGPHVYHKTLLSSLSRHTCLDPDLGPKPAWLIRLTLHEVGRWATQTSNIWASAGTRPTPPLNPHFNRPSGHWPCVKPCLVGGRGKYRKKMKRRISTLTLLENGKIVEYENDVYANCNWCSWNSHRRINKGTGRVGNKRTSGDHPNYYIIDISRNTEKSPGDLKRFAVTQTPAKDHQLTLMLKLPWSK